MNKFIKNYYGVCAGKLAVALGESCRNLTRGHGYVLGWDGNSCLWLKRLTEVDSTVWEVTGYPAIQPDCNGRSFRILTSRLLSATMHLSLHLNSFSSLDANDL